jgi:hypothetical protein
MKNLFLCIFLLILSIQPSFAIQNITFTDGSGFTTSVSRGSTNQAIGRFSLFTVSGSITLTGAIITLNGTRSGVSNLKLWESSVNTFSTGTATLISTVAADPGSSLDFGVLSSTFSTSEQFYFITADIASGATGTIQCLISSKTQLTFDAGSSNSFTDALLSNASIPLPVELTSFNASTNTHSVTLQWNTATEINNYGFNIERRQIGTDHWQTIGFVVGNGTSNAPHDYSFTNANVSSGRYAYRLKQIDNDGAFKYSSSAEVEISMPKELILFSNYPNPFNPTTKVQFTVAENGNVRMSVYNILGQEVATLFDGAAEAGNLYIANFDASRMATGLYYSVLEFSPAGDVLGNSQRLTQKMLMTK